MDTDTIVSGILALLVAERDGADGRMTERILADVGRAAGRGSARR